MPAALPSQPIRIGDFQLIAERHELLAADQTIQRLPRRLVELLLRLAAEPGAVVTRQQLLDEVWTRRAVADEVLSRAIADLRVALGDDARTPRYIETIPKTGYRLLAAVQVIPSNLSPVDVEPSAKPVPHPRPRRHGLLATLVAVGCAVAVVAWFLATGPVHDPQSDSASAAPTDLVARVASAAPLTSDAAWEHHPATSADGVWLAYARSEPFSSSRSLHLRHLARGEDRIWADQPGINDSPAFSPDATELAYRHCAAGHCQWLRRGLHGGDAQVIAEASAQAPGLDWSTPGIVAVVSIPRPGLDPENRLAWQPAGGSDWLPLAGPAADGSPDLWPRWIAHTRKVAFVRGSPGLQQLHWVEVDAPQRSGIFELPPSRIQDQRWRNAEEVWLASDLAGFRALLRWQMGTPWSLLGARGTRGIALLPGEGAVLEVAEYDANLHQLALSTLDTVASRVLDVSTRYESHPALSADGRWLALVSLREGADQVWLKDLANPAAPLRRVSPVDAGGQAVRPSFSADSQRLHFSIYSDRGIAAWEYHLQRQQLQPLPALGNDVFALQAGIATGEFVFATHEAGTHLRLWHVAKAGQPRIAIAGAEQVSQFQLAGDQLWWQDSGQSGWQGLELASGTRTQLAAPAHDKSRALTTWTLSDAAIYAVYDDGLLYRRSWRADGDWQALGPLAVNASGPALAVDARHDRVVVARTDRIAVDLFQLPAQP